MDFCGGGLLGKLVTQTEFAELIGVSKQAVHKVLKRGDRLSKSVVETADGLRIDAADGVLEWFLNGDPSHDRGGYTSTAVRIPGVDGMMTLSESNAMRTHYAALSKRLKYEQAAKLLMPVEKYQREAWEIARTTRDRLLNVPYAVTGLNARLLRNLVRDLGISEQDPKLADAVNGCADALMRELKTEITKALRDVSAWASSQSDVTA